MKIKTSAISEIIANETNKMTPLPTQKLFDDLYVIQDSFANIYLIKNNYSYIAIDAGINSVGIKQELDKLNINPNDIDTVLITHSDIDHVYGLDAFPKANIYISEAETTMLDNFRITIPETNLKTAETVFSQTLAKNAPNIFGYGEYWPSDDMNIVTTSTDRFISLLKNRISKPFKEFSSGETLKINQTNIQTIFIPGHTKGLTAYLINNKYLFVGDGLSLNKGYVAPFNSLLNLDESEHLKSISKLKAINNYEYLFTTHYGFTDNVTTAFKNWID